MKKNKKEIKMIDMSARLEVKIIPATEEEIRQIEIEFESLDKRIKEATRKKESELHDRVLEMITIEFSNNQSRTETDKDASYFLEKYGYMVEKDNTNLEERIKAYREQISRHRKEMIKREERW